MKRSFAEIDSAQDESGRLQSLHDLSMELEGSEDVECDHCTDNIHDYYAKCSRLTELHLKMQVCFDVCI